MENNQTIHKARALYYNFFANFFVLSPKIENYFELLRLLNILKDSALDDISQEGLNNISNLLDKDSKPFLYEAPQPVSKEFQAPQCLSL